jgi:hypothetical protein
VIRFGLGDHFGEIGVLSGTATVYELAKEELTRILDAHPEVSQALNRSLTRRRPLAQLVGKMGSGSAAGKFRLMPSLALRKPALMFEGA